MTMTMASRVPDQQDTDGPTPQQIRRGRRTALLLFGLGFGPMILATVMFYTGWLNPAGHTNKGSLIQPVIPVQTLGLETLSGEPLEARFGPDKADARWLLMVVADDCGADCQQLLYLARQVNIALGKNASRVARAAALGTLPADLSARWSQDYGSMERLVPVDGTATDWPANLSPDAGPRILLVDPLGNIMMQYTQDNSGKDMLVDLKHLLKLSQIG